MPTFDFQCSKCATVFEYTRPFGSSTTPLCPQCGSKKTEKLITPPAIQFKGSGFYKSDSRGPEKAPPKPKEDSLTKAGAKPTENPKEDKKTEEKSGNNSTTQNS